MYKDFVYGFSDECEGIHAVGASGCICLGAFINPRIFCKSVIDFECMPCTNTSGFDIVNMMVGLSLWRHCKNIVHIDVNKGDCRVPLLIDVIGDNCNPVEMQVEMIVGIHFVDMHVEMVVELYTLKM